MIRGMLLGKFMPPTMGHKYLVDFAAAQVEELTVLMCSTRNQPIQGELRYQWVREAFPGIRVRHHTDENPDEPAGPEDHEFWRLWRESIRRHCPDGIDFVFASEDYGVKLATVLDALFIPVDLTRTVVPISAEAVRADPMGKWDSILPQARPYYLKKVCIVGPESTGKTTLAQRLGDHFRTRHVPEYARVYTDHQDGRCTYEEISFIGRGQVASENAAAKQANRVLICDTDLIITAIYSDLFFGKVPDEIWELSELQRFDLYLLMDIDCPWVTDGTRFYGETDTRQKFFDRCREELESRGRPYVVVGGDWENRFQDAVSITESLIGNQ